MKKLVFILSMLYLTQAHSGEFFPNISRNIKEHKKKSVFFTRHYVAKILAILKAIDENALTPETYERYLWKHMQEFHTRSACTISPETLFIWEPDTEPQFDSYYLRKLKKDFRKSKNDDIVNIRSNFYVTHMQGIFEEWRENKEVDTLKKREELIANFIDDNVDAITNDSIMANAPLMIEVAQCRDPNINFEKYKEGYKPHLSHLEEFLYFKLLKLGGAYKKAKKKEKKRKCIVM